MDSSKQQIFLKDEQETLRVGKEISAHLKAGDIVKITGELGAGKTTLVRGIVAGFSGDSSQVHSPTFSLVHEYECPTVSIKHCDFYRLPDGSFLEEFGGWEFFAEEKIYLLEWPEKIGLFESINLKRFIDVHLEIDSNGRKIFLPADWKILD